MHFVRHALMRQTCAHPHRGLINNERGVAPQEGGAGITSPALTMARATGARANPSG